MLEEFTSAAEAVAYLDDLSSRLGRKVRIYVIGHKERSEKETRRLMQKSDVCVMNDAWNLIDDKSRYEWVNQ